MPEKQVITDTQEQQPGFETALEELESLVERMEGGELSLEDSLKEFERGVKLTRICQEALKVAEQRVKLLGEDGVESDFPPAENA